MEDNKAILDQLLDITKCKSNSELITYLNKKYDTKLTKQNIYQFKNSKAKTITSILLREALEKFKPGTNIIKKYQELGEFLNQLKK